MFQLSIIILSTLFSLSADAGELQHQVSLKQSNFQTYYIEGQFSGGKPSMLLLDTGSSYTVINTTELSELQAEGTVKFLKNMDARLADGSRLSVPLYQVSTITLDGNCVVNNVEVAVFPNADRQILGLSTIRRLSPILFMADPPSLKVSNCLSAESSLALTAKEPSANELALIDKPGAEKKSTQPSITDLGGANPDERKDSPIGYESPETLNSARTPLIVNPL